MAPLGESFGVPYNRHKVVHLKSFLEAISRHYKSSSSSTKRTLFSALQDFENSISSRSDQDLLTTYMQAYYEARNTSDAQLTEDNLFDNLRIAGHAKNRNKPDGANEGKMKTNKNTGTNSNEMSACKRKHSEISKGTLKLKKNKPKSPTYRECSVCFEDVLKRNFPTANITATCKHGKNVCTTCIDLHVDARIDIGQFGFINCPMCPEVLVLDDVRRLCTRDTFEKYDRLITRTELQKDPTFHLCLAPDCGSGQYNDDEGSHKTVCAMCQFATCTYHGMAWHEGQTCKEYDIEIIKLSAEAKKQDVLERFKKANQRKTGRLTRWRPSSALAFRKELEKQEARKAEEEKEAEKVKKEEEARKEEVAKRKALAGVNALKRKHALENVASIAYIKDKAKTCPNKECGAPIQENGGCDHMICTQCNTDFIWGSGYILPSP